MPSVDRPAATPYPRFRVPSKTASKARKLESSSWKGEAFLSFAASRLSVSIVGTV